jgi:hypothetical protein
MADIGEREKNARFWTFWRCGWVKLTLRPGQTLSASNGGPTDEGYHGEAEVWTHEGDMVRSEWASWGRDCDGRQEAGGEHVCPLGKLRARDMVEAFDVPENRGIFAPEWERADAWQRDHSAEAAGY